jgi:hypothetical protein
MRRKLQRYWTFGRVAARNGASGSDSRISLGKRCSENLAFPAVRDLRSHFGQEVGIVLNIWEVLRLRNLQFGQLPKRVSNSGGMANNPFQAVSSADRETI